MELVDQDKVHHKSIAMRLYIGLQVLIISVEHGRFKGPGPNS